MDRKTPLRIMTVHGAKYVLKENEIGSIAPGKFGDLVILDRNPLDPSVRDDELSKLQVMLTMVGGKVVFDAEKDPRPKPRGRRDTGSDDRQP